MSWDPNALKRAAKKSGVTYDVDTDWLKIDPYKGGFNPVGVVWHHTATGLLTPGNMPSLNWCRNPGQYAGQARACHIVVGRDGSMQIIAGKGAYHAGAGGPMSVNGKYIPKDLGNRFLLGIEIEAASSTKVNKKNRQTPKSGINPAQYEAVAKFCAALFDELGWETAAAIRHRDWAPGRKIDVGIPLSEIREKIDSYRKAPAKPATPAKPKPEKPAAKPKPPVNSKPAAKPKKPVVRLNSIKPDRKNKQVLVVQEALKKEFPSFDYSSGPGLFGPRTKAAYAKWQKKSGYTGKDASGIPDLTSLRKLGAKHGFTVNSQ